MACMSENEVKRKLRKAGMSPEKTAKVIEALKKYREQLQSEPQLQLQDKSNSLLVPSRAPNGLQNSNVDFNGFDKKEEFHITVLGFPQGKELGEIFAKDPSKKALVQKLINEADFSYTERPEIYKISRDIEQFIDWNNKELGSKMVHEEAIIQLVNAPGVKAFIDKINAELGTNFPVPFPHISMAVKGTKLGIGIPNEAGFAKLNPELLTSSGSKSQIDIALDNKLRTILQKLYPEIKLEYTDNETEYDNGAMNQEIDNSIKLGLKIADALFDFATVKKSKYGGENQALLSTVRLSNETGIRKILSGKGVPKEQIDFMFDYMKSNQIQNIDTAALAERILVGLSTAVEVNTASRETTVYPPKQDYVSMMIDAFSYDLTWTKLSEASHDALLAVVEEAFNGTYGDSLAKDAKSEFPESVSISDIQSVIDDVQSYKVPEVKAPEVFVEPSRYYANLTVPGGTNYKEKEISTPKLIAPRKGHASFATENGIGWYRVDDAVEGGEANTLPDSFIDTQGSKWTKINGIWNVLYKGDTEITVRDDLSDAEAKISYGVDFSTRGGTDIKTLRVLEMQSDMFQKMRDDRLDINDSNKAFLQLLNTDNKWVKFFIQSIVQDSQKQGYKYIRFPAGGTAAKIEGHNTVQDRIEIIDRNIDNIKSDIKRIESNINKYSLSAYIAYKTNSFKTEQRNAGNKYGVDSQEFRNYNQLINDLQKSDAEVESQFGEDIRRYKRMNDFDETTLESRKEDLSDAIASRAQLKSQGLEKLAPIEGFYEVRVKNTLVKTYGQENITTIIDEYGNKWFELKLNSARDSNTIMLQRQDGKIKGQANLEAQTVLINTMLQSQDTLPHEYAHHYISWFRDTPVVQAAIKKWGSEEALVQAIGEQSVKQEGAAYRWWKQFTAWLRNKFAKLDQASKEELAKLLTDAFLARKDLTADSGSERQIELQVGKRAENNKALSDKTDGKITTANIDDIIRGCL